jgi:thiol-disulfide isomerase/thioredoxin
MTRRNFYVWLCAIVLSVISHAVFAQQKSIPKTFPVFNLQLADSIHFNSSSLKKNEPTLLIYFSPTCDHCQVYINEILKNMQNFKNYNIVLVTYVDISEVKKFETDYQLKKYPNIISGTEGTNFTVRYFYNVVTFPFTALYNKDQSLVAVFRQPPSIDKLKNL